MRILDVAIGSSGKELAVAEFVNEYYNGKLPFGKWSFIKQREKVHRLNRTFKKGKQKQIITFIYENFEKIIKASPRVIHKFASFFDRKGYTKEFYNGKKITSFGKAMLDAFDYEAFRKTTKAVWYGKALNIKACIYCNASYALTIENGSSLKMLYQFDHFYNKNQYPFLSLSMFNLIPCCSSCNLSKSNSNFNIKNAIHPYLEDMNAAFKFEPNQIDVINYFTSNKAKKIEITLRGISPKFEKHNSTFALQEIYNCHTDVVEELFLKAYYYNSSKRQEILKLFKKTVDKELLTRFILGNYYLDSELNKRPLSKLTKDVSKKIKLI